MTHPARLTPPECAAVIIMLLGDEEASDLMARLEPEELQRVGAAMCALGELEPRRIADAIAGFVAEAEIEVLPRQSRETQLEALLTRAVGELKAESLMQRIAPDNRPRSVEMARWLAPPILVSLLEEEHPQVITVLLLMLDPDLAAEILSALPPSLQPQVVERIARLEKVTIEAVAMLDQLLSARIERRFGKAALELGGPREAANLINLAQRDVGQHVLPAIERRDSNLAKAIEAEMFTFEMLFALEPQAMGRLLRDVENVDLVMALKGLGEDDQAPFFAAMSSRAADGVRDEMDLLPKLKRGDVLAAQRRIVAIARDLRDNGDIALGEADGEYI